MAIVEQKTIKSDDGVKKTIDKQSMGMALDILQRGLYSFPIKSTVRELASNAHDAIKERDVAKSILAGIDTIESHFDTTKGTDGIYHSSSWDSDYFRTEWLSSDPYVRLYYEEGELRDTLRIIDNGVGLGKDRLLGYFTLNYSSKRTNKDTLGRFGLGSKVALSLGVESFRVITRYNGRKFKFDVYLDKIESAVPMFGSKGLNEKVMLTPDVWETNSDGEQVLVQSAYYANWEPTIEMNGVEVQVETKKHAKNAFFEAIESQLMYMPNILFLHREKDAISHRTIDIKAQVEYQDENIIISKTTVYNKPHILLGTGDVLVNYGFLAFNELEIEPRGGAVGLIMDINEIEITPSREAPVWSTKTRAAVLEKYEKVTETATNYVNQEISNETDYIKWMRSGYSIVNAIRSGTSYQGENSGVLSTLASIIDASKIDNLKFSPDKRIILKNDVKDMFGKQFNLRLISWDNWAKKIERVTVKDLDVLRFPIYLTKMGANKFRDRYLNEEKGKFLLITVKDDYKDFPRHKLILDSSEHTNYDDVEVPEERLSLYMNEGEDDDDEDLSTLSSKSASELRKENKEIVVHEAYKDVNGWVFTSVNKKISDMFNLKPGEIVMYGNSKDRNIMKTIMQILPSYFNNQRASSSDYFDSEEDLTLSAVLIAKENLKYISTSDRFKTIDNIIVESYDDETGHLVIDRRLRHVITAAMILSFVNPLLDKHDVSHYQVLRDWGKDKKLNMLMANGYPDREPVACFIAEVLKHVSDLSSVLPDTKFWKFLLKLGRLQLVNEGIVLSSDEDKENLLADINDSLPDILCDTINEIKSVESLFLDVFEISRDMMIEVSQGWVLINMYLNQYYYRDEALTAAVSNMKIYLKAKLDDASIQQQDNT